MSALTFKNQTSYIAQFVAARGEQIIARLPGIAPEAQLLVPLEDTYEVAAATIIDGNTYTTAPVAVTGPMSFLAQVKQNAQQGTYDFEVKVGNSPSADQFIFQKTTIGPVTFTLSKNGVPLQNVVVEDSFRTETLTVGNVYVVYAVINGITTDTVQTSNPNAIITAVSEDTSLEAGYFTLIVNS
jgi:hypothetical protein